MSLLTAGYFPTTYWVGDYFTDDFWQDYGAPHIIKVFMIRDGGTPKTGLSPIIDLFVKALDGTNVTPVPTVSELGGGYYKFSHDVTQKTVVRVDTNDTSMADADRYIDVGVITPYDDAIDATISGRAPANEYDTQMGYIPPDLGDVPTASELDTAHGSGSWKGTTPSDVADAVWDEDLSDHTTAKTSGKIMQQIKSTVNAILGLIS